MYFAALGDFAGRLGGFVHYVEIFHFLKSPLRSRETLFRSVRNVREERESGQFFDVVYRTQIGRGYRRETGYVLIKETYAFQLRSGAVRYGLSGATRFRAEQHFVIVRRVGHIFPSRSVVEGAMLESQSVPKCAPVTTYSVSAHMYESRTRPSSVAHPCWLNWLACGVMFVE